MKPASLLAMMLLFSLALSASSQQRAPADPLAALSALEARNKELLQRQDALVQKLGEILANANQLRIFTKRG